MEPPGTTPAAAETRQTAVVVAAIEAMQGTLAVAAALAGAGRRVDLSGLEEEVGRLCAAALAAPRAAAPALRLRLEALLSDLDRLRAALAPP